MEKLTPELGNYQPPKVKFWIDLLQDFENYSAKDFYNKYVDKIETLLIKEGYKQEDIRNLDFEYDIPYQIEKKIADKSKKYITNAMIGKITYINKENGKKNIKILISDKNNTDLYFHIIPESQCVSILLHEGNNTYNSELQNYYNIIDSLFL